MKIERINENQIRCTLTSFDLSVRDLNLGELAYGSEKAKRLFREMIHKASSEVGFEAEDIPLMVEAIPMAGESIMLIITKIEDPEELDTRFSKFSPAEEDEENGLSALASELLEGAEGLLGLFTQGPDSSSSTAQPGSVKAADQADGEKPWVPTTRSFTFDSLEQVCEASRIVGQVFSGPSTLYKNPVNGRFYLMITEAEPNSDPFNRFCNLMIEYGTWARADRATIAYFDEHYEVIVKEHAIQTLAKL